MHQKGLEDDKLRKDQNSNAFNFFLGGEGVGSKKNWPYTVVLEKKFCENKP
jgi:hypothetical protein